MDYIRKIPLLMGVGAALLIGIAGYASGVPNRDNSVNILLGMVIFYITGIFIRSVIKNIIEQALMKMTLKKQEEDKQQQALNKEEERKQKERQKENQPGRKLDLVADEQTGPGMSEEDFDALPVADFIRKELK